MIFSSVLVIQFYADWQTMALWWVLNFVAHCTTAVSVEMNCEMPITRTKTIFQLLGYEQELRLTALPIFKDVMKSYLRVKCILYKNMETINHVYLKS